MSDDSKNDSKLFIVMKQLIRAMTNTLHFDYIRLSTILEQHTKYKPNCLTMIYSQVFIERNEKTGRDNSLNCMFGNLDSSLYVYNACNALKLDNERLEFCAQLPHFILQQAIQLPNVLNIKPKYTCFEIFVTKSSKIQSVRGTQTSNQIVHDASTTEIKHKKIDCNSYRYVAINANNVFNKKNPPPRDCLNDMLHRKRLKSIKQEFEIYFDTETNIHKDEYCGSLSKGIMEKRYFTRGIVKSGKSNPDNCVKKQVCFNLIPEVHVIRAWDFAYRSARKGIWENCARDRYRFQQRVQRAAIYINPILNPEHRSKIFVTRFASLSIVDTE